MQAIVYTQYGSPNVLHLKQVEKPAPGNGEVLVKVHAVSLNAYDLHFLRADPFFLRLMGGGFLKPTNTILGADMAGVVVLVGKNAGQFQPGDEVFGDIGSGGLAEYACARENRLALKPVFMTVEQAAATPMAALTALQGLRDHGQLQPGQKVLINGAGGGVGTFAIQIAKSFGAEVTAVCGRHNLDLARGLGADQVIDYTREDFTKNGLHYDLILAVNGYHSIFAYRRALSPNGIYVMAGGSLAQLLQGMLMGTMMSRSGGQKMGSFLANINQKDMGIINELVESGKVKPVIDRSYPFAEAAEAFRYLEEGHARGKVVITVEQAG